MCEVLVRVVDKTSPDPYRDVQLTKRGDVIAVVENGHQWGTGDLTNPHWRIFKLPNVSVKTAQNFIAPEIDIDPVNPSRMLRRRAIKLDLASALLPQDLKDWLSDDTRVEPIRTVSLTPIQFAFLKLNKTKLVDPNIL